MDLQTVKTNILDPMRDPAHEIFFSDCREIPFDIRSINHYSVLLITEGECRIAINGASNYAHDGELLLVKPGDKVSFDSKEGFLPFSCYEIAVGMDCMRIWNTYQKLDQAACFRSPSFSKDRIIPLAPIMSETGSLLERLCQFAINDRPNEFGSYMLKENLASMAYITVNRICNRYETLVKAGGSSLAEKIKNYIDLYYAEDLSIRKMAALFYINESHLMHTFKKETGISIHQYTMNRRLSSAQAMLQSGVKPSAVYSRCGFGDYTSFFRQFKSKYGISPREYAALYPQQDSPDEF